MLFTLQKNLMMVHLWGTFAKPLAPRGSSGILLAVNQNKYRHLIGRRCRRTRAMRCTLNGNTVFGNIFTFLKKKGTATSMFNNSPVLYRNICSTCVQNLGYLSVWTPKLCISEVRKHVVQLKLLYSPTSFLTIKVNFDKIRFEGYCIYRPNSFLWWKYMLFTSKLFLGVSILYLDNYLCYEENENTGKYILYNIWNIFKKKAPIGKRGYHFGEKPSIYHYEIDSTVSELNPELWKTGVLP